jgi:hypothetical protein
VDNDPRRRSDALHQALLAGGRGIFEEAADLFYPGLIAHLSSWRRFRRSDPELIEDAVVDALLEYVARPQGFNPSRRPSLEKHLLMAARRNMLNLLRAEGRRRRREKRVAEQNATGPTGAVELQTPAGNLERQEEAAALAEDRDGLMKLLSDPLHRRVLELRLDGEHRTNVFAGVLGITNLPVPEQRRLVKRVKDQIDKVLRRAQSVRSGETGKK